jgi:fatty-acyl-CoA synthase
VAPSNRERQPHRGNTVVSGYYRNEAANREAIDEEGWLKTGDISSIDPTGFMTVVDRGKDLIKSDGEWISSIELESLAAGCPGIATCAVIGVPNVGRAASLGGRQAGRA